MGYINTSIELDVNKLKREYNGKLDETQKTLDGLILRDCEQYVPQRRGDLRKSGDTGGEGEKKGGVTWDEDYTRLMYYGKLKGGREIEFHTPGTTKRWFEHAKYIHLREWLQAVQM